MPTISTASRIDGFRQALKDFDLPVVDDWIVSGPLTFEGGYQTAHQLLAQAPELTAISAHNDVVALGAIKACRELGRRVPDDFAIVGFNDIEFAAMVDPPLTTVHFDQYQHGQGIMTRLIDMIDCPECEFPPIVVDCTGLVIRKSA
jgi:DNA-binding LacI/PurR family transcriptional regulator